MNPPIFDRSKTLEELEEEDWGIRRFPLTL